MNTFSERPPETCAALEAGMAQIRACYVSIAGRHAVRVSAPRVRPPNGSLSDRAGSHE